MQCYGVVMARLHIRDPGARRALIACAAALLCAWPVAARASTAPPVPKGAPSAALEECVTVGTQAERSATFAGEMTTVAGSARMEMRIEVTERTPGQLAYHTLVAPGLGVWRTAAPGVRVYRYLKQVTNLAGPAFYRAVVRYRWLAAHGRVVNSATLRTKRCEQPSTETPGASTPAGGSATGALSPAPASPLS